MIAEVMAVGMSWTTHWDGGRGEELEGYGRSRSRC